MVYQRLGIPTVATVRWTADQMIQRLLPVARCPSSPTRAARSSSPRCSLAEPWIGRRLTDIEEQTGARIAYVTRLGEGTSPAGHDDPAGRSVHLAVLRDDLARVERLCDQPPAAH